MNNTGFTPTNTSSSLFPPLTSETNTLGDNQRLLWNVNNFGNESESSGSPPNNEFPTYPVDKYPADKAEDSTSFNISWGGDDKPPTELHPIKELESPMKLSRPLPKPRGIRKLPEPEPSEDGTIDEYTLKRRKVKANTYPKLSLLT
jgi:hypothetical protein